MAAQPPDSRPDSIEGRSEHPAVPELAVPMPRSAGETDPLLDLELSYPDPGTARLRLYGEVDVNNTSRVSELLRSRLRSELRPVVLDLSLLGFLSTSGAQMLVHADEFARSHGTELQIVAGDSYPVRIVLRVTGLDQHLPLSSG